MLLLSKVHVKIFIFQILMACNSHSCFGSTISGNYEKFFLNEFNSTNNLRVLAIQNEPFLYRHENGQFEGGIEYKLIRSIAEKERLTLTFLDRFNAIDSNGHALFTFNRYSDVLAGGLFPNVTFLDAYTISNTYYQDDMTWCVPKAKFYSLLLNGVYGTSLPIWCTGFATFYFIGFIVYIYIQFDLEYEQRNQHDFNYVMLSIILPTVFGSNNRFHPKLSSIRIYYVFTLLITFILWQVVFLLGIEFMKTPIQQPQISSVNDIVSKNFRLSGSTEVFGLIASDERYQKSQVDAFIVCSSIDICLEHLKHNNNSDLAVGGSRQHIFNSRSFSPSKIFCFNENEHIAGYQPVLWMRKHFPLKKNIDKYIRNAFESGLFVKWDRDSQRKKERIVPFQMDDPITMTLFRKHIFTFGPGWTLAVMALIGELFVEHMKRITGKHKIWTFFERALDGRRNYFTNLPEKLMRHNLTPARSL